MLYYLFNSRCGRLKKLIALICLIVLLICYGIHMEDTVDIVIEQEQEEEQAPIHVVDEADLCEGENMVYNITSIDPSLLHLAKGRLKFDCHHLPLLKQFQLVDQPPLAFKNDMAMGDLVFVLAATAQYYHRLRATIDSILTVFQYSYRRLIIYDLGGIHSNATMMDELNNVCQSEIRQFDYSHLPLKLRAPQLAAWKALILAEVFSQQHDTFIYCDTSVYFVENNFADYYELINDNRLVGIQLTKSANRGIRASTNERMHNDYLPLSIEKEDVEMFQTSMILVKRSDEVRHILKWALLCSVTPSCIFPSSSLKSKSRKCVGPQDSYLPPGSCHARFTSVLNTLIANRERYLLDRGHKVIRHSAFNHPSKVPNVRERHLVVKEGEGEEEVVTGRIDTCRSKRDLFKSFNEINAFTISKEICKDSIE